MKKTILFIALTFALVHLVAIILSELQYISKSVALYVIFTADILGLIISLAGYFTPSKSHETIQHHMGGNAAHKEHGITGASDSPDDQ